MVSCENIRERTKLERSPNLHGGLPYDLLGKPEDAKMDVPATVLGKNVEVVDMTFGWGQGTPLWPSQEDMMIQRMTYHARNRVFAQAANMHRMHLSTHTDAPIHVEEEYPTIDQVPITHYFGKGVVVDIPKGKWGIITAEDLDKAEPSIERGDIVVVHTGWHRFYADSVKYYLYGPGFVRESGEWFVKKKVKAVGYDLQSADHPLGTKLAWSQPGGVPPLQPWLIEEYKKETGREVKDDFPYWEPNHRLLLTHGIPNIECVGGDIDKAVGKRCTIFAVPTKWIGGDGSPVRCFAILEKK